jgi:heat shock protein HslJ/membrane-bound inhibitor of C-type lysozyme
MALLALAGCTVPPAVAPTPATWVHLQCGNQAASVVFDADGALLAFAGSRIALQPVVSASGARYEASGDGATWLWNKGPATTIALRGQAWDECRAVPAPPWRALGQEPSWLLNIDGASARLTLGMGAEVVTANLPEPRVTRTTRTYSGPSSAGPMTVVITEQRCADTMSGMPHPATVQVGLRGQVFKGCGGEPVALLGGVEWRVDSIGGAALVNGSAVSLRFTDDGSVWGQAGCNRFSGRYRLSGEGLTIMPPAATRMACSSPLMAQEARFFELLGAVQRFDIGADGALLLRSAAGQDIVARRP